MLVLRLSSRLNAPEEILRLLNAEKHVAQIFDPTAVLSQTHLEHSLALAQKTFAEKRNIAKSLTKEWLLFAAATPKINVAISLVGAKSTKDFLLAFEKKISKKETAALLAKLKAEEIPLKFADEKTIAEKFALNKNALKKYSTEDLLLEKIALSRIKD